MSSNLPLSTPSGDTLYKVTYNGTMALFYANEDMEDPDELGVLLICRKLRLTPDEQQRAKVTAVIEEATQQDVAYYTGMGGRVTIPLPSPQPQ